MKFFDLFIVANKDLEKYWWHRLAKIIIFGTTIAVFISCVYINIFNHGSESLFTYYSIGEQSSVNPKISIKDQLDNLRKNNSVNSLTTTQNVDREAKDRSLLFDIAISTLYPILWFIFWESLIYRSFVYIVLGKPGATAYDTDSLYDVAISLLIDRETVSAAFLQRKLKIGYSRSAFLIDKLENDGYLIETESGYKVIKK
jgi:hypothetical protein